MTVYRVTQPDFQDSPIDGEGARLFGGRWNSKGISLTYTAQNLSLAMLEILVNLDEDSDTEFFVYFEVEIPDELIATPGITPGVAPLPVDWNQGSRVAARNYGDDWASRQLSLVLRVPSAVNPVESNFLINVRHPDFHRITCGQVQSLNMDDRLLNR